MKKLTYGEQLRHPNWQRVRLERLNAAAFTCQCCGDKDTMLHVHHKQYFKGRMAWEYEPDELLFLCESCHELAHEIDDELKTLLVLVGPAAINSAIPMLAGWFECAASLKDLGPFRSRDGRLAAIGSVGFALRSSDLDEREFRLMEWALFEDPQFLGDIRAAVQAHQKRKEAGPAESVGQQE